MWGDGLACVGHDGGAVRHPFEYFGYGCLARHRWEGTGCGCDLPLASGAGIVIPMQGGSLVISAR